MSKGSSAATPEASATLLGVSLVWPTENTYENGVIPSYAKFGSKGGKHTGLDFGTLGNDVVAAADGTVSRVRNLRAGGWAVWITHANNVETRYLHLMPDSITTREGRTVTQGQMIAKVGYSGLEYAYGSRAKLAAHLHFEVLKDGVFIDPEAALGGGAVITSRGPRFSESVPTAAPTPGSNAVWPLVTGSLIVPERTDKWPLSSRSIGARRSNGARGHAGVDLFAKKGDPVLAVDDGQIVRFYWFYRGTYALVVQHSGYVVIYCEVMKESMELGWDSPLIRIGERGITQRTGKTGSQVKAGQQIALVGKMFRSSMLHFEMYESGTTANWRWTGFPSASPPSGLLDPTQFLLTLRDRKRGTQTTTRAPTVTVAECR